MKRKTVAARAKQAPRAAQSGMTESGKWGVASDECAKGKSRFLASLGMTNDIALACGCKTWAMEKASIGQSSVSRAACARARSIASLGTLGPVGVADEGRTAHLRTTNTTIANPTMT